MPKQFIKITKTNVHKNKVQKLCQDELNDLDQTVFPDLKEAVRFINRCFDHAISSYVGSAKKPELRNFSPKDKEQIYYIEDLIYISIYEVKNEKMPV